MNKVMYKINSSFNVYTCISIALCSATLLSTILLSSSIVSANTDSTDTVSLTVSIACTMTGEGTSHTATLDPGTYSGATGSEYENGIGKTTLTAICNDDNGFSIYAIGYTGNQYEGENHTKLVGQSTNGTIATKAYASGDTTSNWSMKLTKITDSAESYNPQNLTISTGYDTWHAVPDTYTKVAEYHANTGSSTTDTTLGVKLETTYAAYISSSQPADTYIGQVKYTMVHPYDNTPKDGPIANCPVTKVCYSPNANDVEGTMGQQQLYNAATITSVNLLASNFNRKGYGFAGWSDKHDYATNSEAKFYGPNETMRFTAGQYYGTNQGIKMYAVWVESRGNLQDSAKVAELCGEGPNSLEPAPIEGAASLSSVAALTDERDNQTYAIAKLADGNCWMIENLRLEAKHSLGEINKSLAQGYGEYSGMGINYGNFLGLPDAETGDFYHDRPNSLYSIDGANDTININSSDSPRYRMPRYNNKHTAQRTSNANYYNDNIFGYGNYYTWAAAMANTTYFKNASSVNAEGKTSETVNTSICPKGWRLPFGRAIEKGQQSGGFSYLDMRLGGTGADSSSNTTPTGVEMARKWVKFPNNFLFAGSLQLINGDYGGYMSATAYNEKTPYSLFIVRNEGVKPGTDVNYNRDSGLPIRCVSEANL